LGPALRHYLEVLDFLEGQLPLLDLLHLSPLKDPLHLERLGLLEDLYHLLDLKDL
tara:strand:- start:201 stop:365 length:165 start_codon:yes stop_codon:yes gene_type:complete